MSETKPEPPESASSTAPSMPGPYDPDPPETIGNPPKKPSRPSVLNVLTLEEVLDYQPPPGSLLVGDGVIEAGNVTLLFGLPGAFKSFAVGELMVCGFRGKGKWLGFEVREQFASLWINCENSRIRLKKQFAAMNLPPEANDYIFTTGIPDIWSFQEQRVVAELRETIIAHNIKLLIVDTVSCFTTDEMAKDFIGFFRDLHNALVGLPWQVAVLIVHHQRKPKEMDNGGRDLLHTISGHQILQRRCRCILYLGRPTRKLKENVVVAACLKCNDSPDEEGKAIAVKLNERNELEEVPDYDLSEWEAGKGDGGKKEPKVTLDHLRELFDDGKKWLTRSEARDALMILAGVGRTTAYDALKASGDYGAWMRENPANKKISIKREEP